jgi:hypothetical protein
VFIMGAMRSCWSLFWVREIILIFSVSRQRYNVSESWHEPCTHPSIIVVELQGGNWKSSHTEASVTVSACGCDGGCDCAGGCAGVSTALVAATALATLESALEAALVAALEAAPVAAAT